MLLYCMCVLLQFCVASFAILVSRILLVSMTLGCICTEHVGKKQVKNEEGKENLWHVLFHLIINLVFSA